ncbi:hypothetical protein [Methylotuvimicrobium sp. KM2]|uniref:hypothetical protein n=1 Tax=Methylotuvimicrobium sp. KM2 TaxID=3133976 RepID=UPI0031012EC2
MKDERGKGKGERGKEKGERRKEKGERRKEKGERRKEKGERRKEKGERFRCFPSSLLGKAIIEALASRYRGIKWCYMCIIACTATFFVATLQRPVTLRTVLYPPFGA